MSDLPQKSVYEQVSETQRPLAIRQTASDAVSVALAALQDDAQPDPAQRLQNALAVLSVAARALERLGWKPGDPGVQ